MRSPLIALLVFAASCALSAPKDVDFRQQALLETQRREALWKAQGIHHYNFDFDRSCQCDPVANQPVTIHVRNDVITHVVDAQGADVAPVQGLPWPTVDSLFLWTKLLLADRTFAVDIAFDTTISYPKHIQAQNAAGIAIYDSSNLVATTATAPIMAFYRIGAPASKSKSVTWRSR